MMVTRGVERDGLSVRQVMQCEVCGGWVGEVLRSPR